MPLFRELGKLPTLCVLNWNAVSLSNSEPLNWCYELISLFMYLNFKWRESLVPAAAVIPAPLAYTIIVAVKRLVVGLNCRHRVNSLAFVIFSTYTINTHTFQRYNRYASENLFSFQHCEQIRVYQTCRF